MTLCRFQLAAFCLYAFSWLAGTGSAAPPNIVLIMTDNHGAWTLGCYGNRDIRTPHIDGLAKEGVRFTRAFASNPVCSPTRATCLTGLIPSQHGVHCFLVGGRLQVGPEARCTLDEITSLPEILKHSGYACGLVGKWHLGDNLNPQEGFDDYWITMPHGGTSTFYNANIIHEGKIRTEPEYLTDFWTRHAVDFISKQVAAEKPFFLFLSYNGPYALSRFLLQDGKNRHAEYYSNRDLPSFPREPAHPWQHSNLDFHNNPTSIRRVATEISGVDDGVGTILQTLKEQGIDDNTLVVFIADQGWVGGQGGFFGMGDHTRPVSARDGMMHIPLIWRHPGIIPAGLELDSMFANYDLMPSLLGYLGLQEELPDYPRSPGRDVSAHIRGQAAHPPVVEELDEAVFYEFEGLRCIRTEGWKYIHRHPNGPHELYELAQDPEEFNNLVDVPAYTNRRQQLKNRLDQFYDKHAVPKYDMWHGGGSQAQVFVGIDEEVAQLTNVAEPEVSTGFVPARLQVPDGFSVELAAGPPLVQHPTFATFDDQGRLFVSENAGVNMSAEELEQQLPNSIRLLEDTDQDGLFDKSTVFADRLTFPMGGAWHAGSLYVASPPHIWKFTDTNHDGVADQRVPLVGKFGYTGNAASIHGCFSGPDGRLYWCDGYHGHEFQDASGQIVSQREGSYIFSCRPDGSDVRLHCGGGMDNPVEVDFTETGEVLGTVNILYTQPRVDAFVHWLHGGAYPHRERVLAEIKTTGELLGPVHPFGHVAVSGTMRYRSGAMDHRWRDNYFATFFNSGRVVRLELERRGASFAAVQREFLSSASSEFHPTDVVEDADGSLLVVDTGGWFYRGCPTSQFAKPDILGGIYRVRRTGMTSVVDPRGLRIDWSKQSNSQLAAWLGDTRFAVREQAISQCVARGSSMIPILADILTKPNHVQRLGALWALTRLAGNENDSSTPNSPAQTDSLESTRRLAIRSALQDPHQLVRQAACHSLATYPDEQALEHLIELLDNDAQPAIRRQAATALGRLGDEQAVPHLLSACRHAVDRTEQHAIIYALIEANKPTSTRAGLTDVDPTARRAALIALDQMAASNLTVSEVLQQLTSADPTLKNDIAVLFSRHSEWSGQAVHVLRALLRDGAAENSQLPDALKRLIAQSLEQESVRELLGQVLADPQSQPQHVNWILEAIAAGNKLPCHASWTDPLKALLDSPDSRLLEAALRAIAALDTDSFSAKVNTLADDALRSTSQRVFASQVAARNLTQLSEAAFELLIETLMQAGPVESLRAAELLSANGLSKTQLLTLAPMLSQAGPSQIQTLLRTFQRSNDPEVGKAFLNSLEQARALSVISPPAFSDIIKRYPTELLPQANAILAQLRQSELDKLSKLDPLMSSLATADVERGRELFFSEKAKCGACHRVDQQGTNIGPDLSTIGFNRTQRDLLESILFPTATIVRDYEAYSIVTVDGLVVNGLIKRETLDAITVQPAAGDPVEIARDDIDQMSPSNVSIMPNGLDEVLGPAEIADIVAYLMSRRG